MKVVFIRSLDKVAGIGDTKEVSDGYARNFLFRYGYAVLQNDARAHEALRTKQTLKHTQAEVKKEPKIKISKRDKRIARDTIKEIRRVQKEGKNGSGLQSTTG